MAFAWFRVPEANVEPVPADVTSLLNKLADGDQQAAAELVPLVYEELRRLAVRCLRHERSDHTLQATALVHEAYMKLSAQRHAKWQNRAQFFAVASQLMRRILSVNAAHPGRLRAVATPDQTRGETAQVPLGGCVPGFSSAIRGVFGRR